MKSLKGRKYGLENLKFNNLQRVFDEYTKIITTAFLVWKAFSVQIFKGWHNYISIHTRTKVNGTSIQKHVRNKTPIFDEKRRIIKCMAWSWPRYNLCLLTRIFGIIFFLRNVELNLFWQFTKKWINLFFDNCNKYSTSPQYKI